MSGHSWGPQLSPALQQACLLCGCPEGLMRSRLVCPSFMSHVVCDVCTRDLHQLVPFQLERSLPLLPGQKQP